jgi:hypothetical protein
MMKLASFIAKVNSKSLVLFAVNDNTDLEAAGGGSHWSLLVYFGGVDTFRHYDSSPGRGSRYINNILTLGTIVTLF